MGIGFANMGLIVISLFAFTLHATTSKRKQNHDNIVDNHGNYVANMFKIVFFKKKGKAKKKDIDLS